jgi:hypothetical protein
MFDRPSAAPRCGRTSFSVAMIDDRRCRCQPSDFYAARVGQTWAVTTAGRDSERRAPALGRCRRRCVAATGAELSMDARAALDPPAFASEVAICRSIRVITASWASARCGAGVSHGPGIDTGPAWGGPLTRRRLRSTSGLVPWPSRYHELHHAQACIQASSDARGMGRRYVTGRRSVCFATISHDVDACWRSTSPSAATTPAPTRRRKDSAYAANNSPVLDQNTEKIRRITR